MSILQNAWSTTWAPTDLNHAGAFYLWYLWSYFRLEFKGIRFLIHYPNIAYGQILVKLTYIPVKSYTFYCRFVPSIRNSRPSAKGFLFLKSLVNSTSFVFKKSIIDRDLLVPFVPQVSTSIHYYQLFVAATAHVFCLFICQFWKHREEALVDDIDRVNLQPFIALEEILHSYSWTFASSISMMLFYWPSS